MTKSSGEHYDAVAVALHWTMALGIFVLTGLGLAMKHAGLPKARVIQLFQLHKSIGIVMLLLAVARLAWRFVRSAPPLPDALPTLERQAAHVGHAALYVFMLALPLTGWAVVSTAPLNIPTVLFGLVPWPHIWLLADLPNKAPAFAVAQALHKYGAYALIAVVAGHVGAALRHAMKGDVPLTRMSFFAGPGDIRE
ncbi:cytochrome b [Rhodoblastus sp.]|uniref:cytochrome b n=1 Tax=Rhodoblastus sp. TaxID=1962975 RepID=UPI002636D9D0|nr:cytochrome b [Rhodoblastus sp.]